MAIIGNPILLSGGGGAKLNIFSGTTEPSEKNGIWFNTTQDVTNVVQDNQLWTPNTWGTAMAQSDTLTSDMYSVEAIYYDSYIYRVGGTGSTGDAYGLYRQSIVDGTIEFLCSGASPYNSRVHALCQSSTNQNIFYFTQSSSNSTSASILIQYDISTRTKTNMGTISTGTIYHHAIWDDDNYVYIFKNIGASSGDKSSMICKFTKGSTTVVTYDKINIEDYFMKGLRIGSNIYYIGRYDDPDSPWYCFGFYKMSLDGTSFEKIASFNANTWSIPNTAVSGLYPKLTTDGTSKLYFSGFYNGGLANTKGLGVFDINDLTLEIYDDPSDYNNNCDETGVIAFGNGRIYVTDMTTSGYTTHYTLPFELIGKSLDSGTVAIARSDNFIGIYRTELISPKERPVGVYNLFKTSFDDAYISINGALTASVPTYYGDGNSWVLIR